MKIHHSADWHVKDSMIEEAEKCLNFLVDTAFKESPELVVIAGDIFDSQDIKLDSSSAYLVVRTVSELANICPVVILTGTPSHDGNAPMILNYAKGDHPVWVANMPEQIYLIGGELTGELEGYPPDLVISLVPQPTKQFFQGSDQEIGQAMTGIFAGFGAGASAFDCPHILVGHFNVSGAFLSNGQVLTGKDIEISKDQLMLANADICMLGHIHAAQKIGDIAYYSGSLFRQNWGEMEDKGFWIHGLCEHGDIEKFIETPCRRLVRVQCDETAATPEILDLTDCFKDIPGAHFRLDMKCWQDEAEFIDKEAITAAALEAGAESVDIRIIRVPRETVRAAEVLKAESLRDKIVKMAELRNETVEWSVLAKADLLEGTKADELLERMAL